MKADLVTRVNKRLRKYLFIMTVNKRIKLHDTIVTIGNPKGYKIWLPVKDFDQKHTRWKFVKVITLLLKEKDHRRDLSLTLT